VQQNGRIQSDAAVFVFPTGSPTGCKPDSHLIAQKPAPCSAGMVTTNQGAGPRQNQIGPVKFSLMGTS
jgi:hypothetical protein